MEILIALGLLVLVAVFVSAPLRRAEAADAGEDPVLAELEAAKEAKYREIKDLELDRAAGKLDDDEYQSQRSRLRREAADILAREKVAKDGITSGAESG
jgi:hypothetical protein